MRNDLLFAITLICFNAENNYRFRANTKTNTLTTYSSTFSHNLIRFIVLRVQNMCHLYDLVVNVYDFYNYYFEILFSLVIGIKNVPKNLSRRTSKHADFWPGECTVLFGNILQQMKIGR